MNVEQLAVSKKKAEQEYLTYKEELRHSKVQFNRDMLSLYAHMKHGGKVIDLWEAMKTGGLDEHEDPKLAIARADSKQCRFKRCFRWEGNNYLPDGGLFLRQHPTSRNKWNGGWSDDIRIPDGFFPPWSKDPKTGRSIDRTIETLVPVVPARIMNPLRSHKFENYHILWEVEKWSLVVPPKDPMLMKKVTPNMFLVLATWDLSELERAVIRGRLQ